MKRWGLGLICFFAMSSAPAAVIEETGKLAIDGLTTAKGESLSRSINVTVFRDDSRKRSPFVIIHHGRVWSQKERAARSASSFRDIANSLVTRGFAVFVPVRMGYGDNADIDIEDSGTDCEHRNYRTAFAPGISQAITILEYVRRQPYVDASRGIVIGNSFGAMVTLASLARNPTGVIGAVNFSGGSGADSEQVGKPCNRERLDAVIRESGSTSRIPSLWLYSANDEYWGPTLPLEWHKIYVGAGGKAEFFQLPSYEKDAHNVIINDPKAWLPRVDRFINSLGFNVVEVSGSGSESAARDAILARSRAFSEAYLRNDNSAIAELYTSDATLVSPSREVRGREEGSKLFVWGPGHHQLEHSLRSTSLEIRGDVAIDVGTSSTASQRGDAAIVRTAGMYMVVWVRESDGAWRIKYDMWHRLPPP